MLRTLALLTVFLFSISEEAVTIPPSIPTQNPLCGGCQFAVNLVEGQLKKIETVTKTDLTRIADRVCAKAPKLEVIETLCTSVKDDLIDIAVQLIESIERQVSGNVTCKVLRLCT